jgi:hypothetical protein
VSAVYIFAWTKKPGIKGDGWNKEKRRLFEKRERERKRPSHKSGDIEEVLSLCEGKGDDDKS